ncbi:hypothetical protein D3C84_855310 [compost metagenome]
MRRSELADVDCARRDRIDRNAITRKLNGALSAEHFDAAFRHAVHDVEISRPFAMHRRDINDAAEIPLLHIRDNRLHALPVSLKIDVHDAVILFFRIFEPMDIQLQRGVVDQNVDAAKLGRSRIHHADDLSLIGDIRLHGHAQAAERFDLLLRVFGSGIAGIIVNGNLRAASGKLDRDAFANARSRASDKCRFSAQAVARGDRVSPSAGLFMR